MMPRHDGEKIRVHEGKKEGKKERKKAQRHTSIILCIQSIVFYSQQRTDWSLGRFGNFEEHVVLDFMLPLGAGTANDIPPLQARDGRLTAGDDVGDNRGGGIIRFLFNPDP